MCTYNQCFNQKKKYHNFSSENNHFYSREILLYIVLACFRDDDRIFYPYFTPMEVSYILGVYLRL